MIKKVLMFHYRFGKTDGVSLQMEAWKKILAGEGIKVEVCAGPESEGADYVVPDFEHQLNPAALKLYQESYGGLKEYDEVVYAREFNRMALSLLRQFRDVLRQANPDRVIVSNVFSVGVHLPAAVALAQVLEEFGVKTVAVHHDFYWENVRYKDPSCRLAEMTLQKFFPPIGLWITHCCINSLAQQQLKTRKGVEAQLLPDTHDFDLEYTDASGHCQRALAEAGITADDLVVLQATRIVRRKNIELAMDLVEKLQKRVAELGKKRVVLVMGGYAEKKDEWYLKKLLVYSGEKGINLVHLQGVSALPDVNKCDLFNLYARADLVTYPSEYEGFGNQFLEAVAARKLIVIFEYPVYEKDIKPLGFETISLGNKLAAAGGEAGWAKVDEGVLVAAVDRIVQVVNSNQKRNEMVEKNYSLAREAYGYAAAQKVLMQALTVGDTIL